MGSKALHRGGAAQSKPENSTATEVNGQHKSQNRTGCPKVEQKTSREGSHWAAKSSTAAELPKTSRKTSPRGSLLGSTRARSVAAAQSTSKKLPAREFNGQPSPAPRLSCPKQAGRHHREGV